MATVTRLPGWNMRVYRVASKQETMGDATAFCRANEVIPYPDLMVRLNPNIKRKKQWL